MVLRTRNGPKHCKRPPCARGMPRAQPRPKTSAPTTPSQNRPAEKGQNGGCTIALVGGCGEVGPPDSKWGQTLLAASVCPRDAPGTAARKNKCPNSPVPKPPSEKGPKRGVCYSLCGRVGRSWSAPPPHQGYSTPPVLALFCRAVLGPGSWGTCFCARLCPGHPAGTRRPLAKFGPIPSPADQLRPTPPPRL